MISYDIIYDIILLILWYHVWYHRLITISYIISYIVSCMISYMICDIMLWYHTWYHIIFFAVVELPEAQRPQPADSDDDREMDFDEARDFADQGPLSHMDMEEDAQTAFYIRCATFCCSVGQRTLVTRALNMAISITASDWPIVQITRRYILQYLGHIPVRGTCSTWGPWRQIWPTQRKTRMMEPRNLGLPLLLIRRVRLGLVS